MLWYIIQILNSTQPQGLPIWNILGLYHVLMYVCRTLICSATIFLLVRTPYVCRPMCFFVLRSYVCKILGLYHVLIYVCRLYWFLLPTIFMLVPNSHKCRILQFFSCTEFLRKKLKHFIPIKNKMLQYSLWMGGGRISTVPKAKGIC